MFLRHSVNLLGDILVVDTGHNLTLFGVPVVDFEN